MALHRELAGNRLQFADVATGEQSLLSPREICRWQALATIQSHYLDGLQKLGIWDPQQARLWAIHQRACRTACDIILVGTVDLNATPRAMLDQVADHVTALIFAPPAIADRFDAYGCVRQEAWQNAAINLDTAHIVFRDNPSDQAEEVLQTLADFNGTLAADDITIGVPDPRLVPHLEQHLEAHHLPFRYGVGTPITHSGPCRLLRGVAEFLDSKGFTAFSNLVRHPAIDQWLNAQGIASSWLAALDDYYRAHLPARLTGRWLPEQRPHLELRRACTAVERLLKPLQGETRSPQLWIEAMLAFLLQVYGDGPDRRDDDTHRTLVTVCEHLHVWLEQIEWLDQGEPDATVLRQAAKHVATTTLDIEVEMQTFRRMINMPQTQKVLSRHGYADLSPLGFSQDCQAALQNAPVTLRVLRERPFAIRDGDAMVYGIIDRLVLFCQHDHVLAADMLDFKSDALALDEATDLRDAIEAYRPQLTLYRRAIARQFGLDIHRIKARLLFLQLGEICQIED
jgi:hypothetical protein